MATPHDPHAHQPASGGTDPGHSKRKPHRDEKVYPKDPDASPGDPPPPRSFREKGLAFFTRELGEPTHIPVQNGTIYRWALPRKGRNDINIYITIDAPELPNMAHIMISDPAKEADQPIKNFTVRDEAEFPSVIAYIRARVDF
jgi:hypothetical protein